MTGETPAPRTAIIDAGGDLLRVVFTSDLPAEDLTGCTTKVCPATFPSEVAWDKSTQSFLPPAPPPPPPELALHQLCDILVTAGTITAQQAAAIKAA